MDDARAELLAAYSRKPIDMDRAGRATQQIRTLLTEGDVNRIDDERRTQLDRALDAGESIRTIMRTVGVAKNTVQAVRNQRAEAMTDIPPSADDVARAIVAACREIGADPMKVAVGLRPATQLGRIETSRARAYAALALRAVFDQCGHQIIARCVAAGSPACYISTLDFNMKRGTLAWWNDDVFMRVVAAIEARP